MEVVQVKNLEEMWDALVKELQGLPSDFNDLQKCYASLLRFTSVLYSEKLRLMKVMSPVKDNAEAFRKEVRSAVLDGMHYEERKMMQLLSQSNDTRKAAYERAEIEVMLEASKRFERLLQSHWEVAKLDFYMSKGGHE